jgi:hypothetical protein
MKWEGCFDPRPGKGATDGLAQVRDDDVVSIHAPAKGRPFFRVVPVPRESFDPRPRKGATGRRQRRHFVSIHAPAKGRPIFVVWVRTFGFRSTPPQRGDFALTVILRDVSGRVSIHAPAKGRHQGQQMQHPHVTQKFRSTPPQRGDLAAPASATSGRPGSFDPRPRKGRRMGQQDFVRVSIHCPAKTGSRHAKRGR